MGTAAGLLGVCIGCVVTTAACTSNGAAPQSQAGSTPPTTTASAPSLCDVALHGRAQSQQATTLGAARRTNIGGPYPGLRPARHAFPDDPASEPAAWCWAQSTHPSPGDAGNTWTLYVAVPGGRATKVFTMGGPSAPPTGPPSIP